MSVEIAPPPPPKRKARNGPGARLRKALLALTNHYGKVDHHQERAWASITFAGTRHTLRIRFEGNNAVNAGEDFVAILPEHEFALAGQLVADASVTAVEHSLTPHPKMLVECELLLLEDA